MKNRSLVLTLALAAAALFAAPAAAQHVSLSANTGSGRLGLTFGDGGVRLSASRPRPRPRASVRATGYRGHAPRRVFVPGRYEVVSKNVWVPGRYQKVWVEPRFELRIDACGNSIRVPLSEGYWREVYVPGRYETQPVRIWRPGYYRAVYR